MRSKHWLRLVAAGTAWAFVYNGFWGLAWIAFMRREWTEAATASGQVMPWTPQFWFVWIPMTLPFGLAVAAYLMSRPAHDHVHRRAMAASLVIWIPGTIGMAFGMPRALGIILLDSLVNLVALLIASLVVAQGATRLLHRP
jgi:hypothetical protein